MSVEEMIAELKARLDDAMELIELQQRMIREGKMATVINEARGWQLHESRGSLVEEDECKLEEMDQDVEDDVEPPVSPFTAQGMQRDAASAAPQQAAASTVPQADQLQAAPVSSQPLASHQAPVGPQAMPATPAKPPNPMLLMIPSRCRWTRSNPRHQQRPREVQS
ncbi:unnamed protein product [Phytophthora fragariaefolia]|uniref:Unnamed protein product n=1 Tax=Phytophthora fragariaefolia TaxID=1490495 RepID=A0A9W6TN76_9STRA|nr:unnamed protein product [Phytophthora fragariaefolia]